MDTRMIAAYDRPVPRYTSHPTGYPTGPSVGALGLRRLRPALHRLRAPPCPRNLSKEQRR
jgi:hypothetical protein